MRQCHKLKSILTTLKGNRSGRESDLYVLWYSFWRCLEVSVFGRVSWILVMLGVKEVDKTLLEQPSIESLVAFQQL